MTETTKLEETTSYRSLSEVAKELAFPYMLLKLAVIEGRLSAMGAQEDPLVEVGEAKEFIAKELKKRFPAGVEVKKFRVAVATQEPVVEAEVPDGMVSVSWFRHQKHVSNEAWARMRKLGLVSDGKAVGHAFFQQGSRKLMPLVELEGALRKYLAMGGNNSSHQRVEAGELVRASGVGKHPNSLKNLAKGRLKKPVAESDELCSVGKFRREHGVGEGAWVRIKKLGLLDESLVVRRGGLKLMPLAHLESVLTRYREMGGNNSSRQQVEGGKLVVSAPMGAKPEGGAEDLVEVTRWRFRNHVSDGAWAGMRHLGLVGEVVVGSRLRQWMPLDVLEEALAQYRRLGSGHIVRGRSLLDDVPEGVVGSGLVEHYNSALETRRQERAQKIEQVAKHLSGPVLAHGGSPIGHRIRFGVLVLLAVMLLGFGGWQLLDILGSGR